MAFSMRSANDLEGVRLFWGAGILQWKAILGSPNEICSPEGLDASKLMVITTDGKGVAVVEEDLREETRKVAQKRREGRTAASPVQGENARFRTEAGRRVAAGADSICGPRVPGPARGRVLNTGPSKVHRLSPCRPRSQRLPAAHVLGARHQNPLLRGQ
jgi:hypothetical protein